MTNYSSNTSTILTVRIANEDLPLSRLLAQHKQQPLRTLMRQVWQNYLHDELAKLSLAQIEDNRSHPLAHISPEESPR